MTCCEPTGAPASRTYRRHLKDGTTPCPQSHADHIAYLATLPPRRSRSQAAQAEARGMAVADPQDYSDPASDVREELREREAAVQWLEDTFTAAEAEFHRRRMATS